MRHDKGQDAQQKKKSLGKGDDDKVAVAVLQVRDSRVRGTLLLRGSYTHPHKRTTQIVRTF